MVPQMIAFNRQRSIAKVQLRAVFNVPYDAACPRGSSFGSSKAKTFISNMSQRDRDCRTGDFQAKNIGICSRYDSQTGLQQVLVPENLDPSDCTVNAQTVLPVVASLRVPIRCPSRIIAAQIRYHFAENPLNKVIARAVSPGLPVIGRILSNDNCRRFRVN